MAEHVWSVLCEKVLHDEADVISLGSIVERLMLWGTSAELLRQAKQEGNKGIRVPVDLRLVTWWLRSTLDEPETIQLRVALLSPDGESLFREVFSVELDLEHPGKRTVVRLTDMLITGLGRYWVLVEKQSEKGRWVSATRIPLYIDDNAETT